VTFDDVPTGLLTTQLQPRGVVFPTGVDVGICLAGDCAAAHSVPHVARGLLADEFDRAPIDVRFTAAQRRVSVWVRSDEAADNPARSVLITITAYDVIGSAIGTTSTSLLSNFDWQQLSVGNLAISAAIRRIVVTGAYPGFSPHNFIVIDDLDCQGDPPPTVLPDTQAPTVQILAPLPSSVFVNTPIDVHVQVQENTKLSTVSGTIVHDATGIASPALDFCGSAVSGLCPATLSTAPCTRCSPSGLSGVTLLMSPRAMPRATAPPPTAVSPSWQRQRRLPQLS
jgi:hypothetical protein